MTIKEELYLKIVLIIKTKVFLEIRIKVIKDYLILILIITTAIIILYSIIGTITTTVNHLKTPEITIALLIIVYLGNLIIMKAIHYLILKKKIIMKRIIKMKIT